MRPKQWVKNGFVFVALIFDEQLFNIPSLLSTIGGFILLSLMSGTVYIINDLVDLDKDKAHPKKRLRPLASGQLKPEVAKGAVVGLLVIGLPLSYALNLSFGVLVTAYLLLQIAYSFKLKNIVIIDVLSIAAGFVIRVAAGVVLIEVTRFSPWLYVFTTMLALFLGFGKRRQELLLAEQGVKNTRSILQEYNIPFVDELMATVTASTILTYAFYTFTAPNLPDNDAMMLTIPFVLYGIFRYLYLIHVRESSGDPSEVVLQDRPLQISIILFGLMTIGILYTF
jgi:4-hydroxybenzoate polyprenyltransferase